MNDRLWVNDGTGHFSDESQSRMTSQMLLSAFGMALEIEDWNGDGVLDVMKDTALNAPQYVSISYNNPNNEGVFNLFEQVHSFAPYHIAGGDLNNDGMLDFISSDDGDDKYRYNTGNDAFGRVDFGSAKEYGGAGECSSSGCTDDGFGSNALIVDLDGDGWNDTIHCDVDVDIPSTQRRFHVYHNPGGAPGQQITLHEEQQFTSNSSGWKGVYGMNVSDQQGTHDIAVFDIDNDGDLDMLVSRFAGTDVWVNPDNPNPPVVCQPTIGQGNLGSATLEICGQALASGNNATLTIENGSNNGIALLLVSISSNPVPVFGGTLYTLPASLQLLLPLDNQGEISLNVPGGGGAVTLYAQAIVAATGGSVPSSLTNALQIDLLP